ncbi:MAG: T9SS type A sorting domain-containing protein [Bacteroidetes bacterium]|nr:T9SS type A sorting domain-containing protein [Bacteroidota bacterium]
MINKYKFYILLLFLGLHLTVFSQWNYNPSINTPVSTSSNDQQDVRIVTDSKGGAIITWVDFRNNISLADIFVQRVNAAGYPLWTSNGKAICTNAADQTAVSIAEAGNGSAILVWQDWRNGNRDIYTQKVDSSGNILWTANGVAVCVKSYNQSSPKIISDALGGAIVVWEDSSAGSWDIYAQRISNTGITMWTTNGVIICNAADSQINPKIDLDGNGGGIITWQDKRNTGDYNIYTQHINASGVVQWTANGVVICNAVGNQTNPKIEPNGSGGAIIGWQDKRGVDYDIYVQSINASGIVQWTANGVPVCTATGSQSAVDMTSDGVNGVIVSWKDLRSGKPVIYASMINSSGTVQWSSNGLALGNGSNPNIAGNSAGGAIITWQDSTSGTSNVYAQNISSSGTKQWGATAIDVGTAVDDQLGPKNVATGNGGVIFAWQDYRNGNNFDVYAHHLAPNGTSGIADLLNQNKTVSCFPNPFNLQTTFFINTQIPIEQWTLTIYDMVGKTVFSKTVANSKSVTFSRNNLSTGIYFYEISNQTKVFGNGKLSITD